MSTPPNFSMCATCEPIHVGASAELNAAGLVPQFLALTRDAALSQSLRAPICQGCQVLPLAVQTANTVLAEIHEGYAPDQASVQLLRQYEVQSARMTCPARAQITSVVRAALTAAESPTREATV
jgi:hypothetical protein